MNTPLTTVAQFRADFPEFNLAIFPDSKVNFWITFATNLMTDLVSRVGDAAPQLAELFIAHNIVLQAINEAAGEMGGIPGIARGVIASYSAGPVSLSYDTKLGGEEGAGVYNLTVYGQQFYHFLLLFGAGPMQVMGGLPGLGYATGSFAGPGAYILGGPASPIY